MISSPHTVGVATYNAYNWINGVVFIEKNRSGKEIMLNYMISVHEVLLANCNALIFLIHIHCLNNLNTFTTRKYVMHAGPKSE